MDDEMEPTGDSRESGREPDGSGWPRAVFWMFAVLVAAGSFLFVFQSCRNLPADTVGYTADKMVQVVTNVSRSLAEIAAAFNQGTISISMNSFGTEVENTKHLQFKKIRQMEVFTRTDTAYTGFGYVPLPDVIVEARAPVEYAYYLDLDDAWRLVVEDGQVRVYTPKIRFNKPSVDVSRLEYEVKSGGLFRDSRLAMENLQRSISSLAFLKAEENVRLVRTTGRETVEEFVEQWLMDSFSDGSNYQVRVFFPGESPADPPANRPLRFEGLENRGP